MQTISVYDDDKDTNLQNLATVLTAHAVPKYFDSVVYDAEATGDDEGIRCYQDGAVVLRIAFVTSAGNDRRHFYLQTSNNGVSYYYDGASTRFTLVDIFDNCIAIHGNGTSVGASTDGRIRTIFLSVNGNGQAGIIMATGSSSSSRQIQNISTSSQNTHSYQITKAMTIGGYEPSIGDYYSMNSAYTSDVSLCHFLNTDGTTAKDMYWACNRVDSSIEAPHRVTVNGEQYWAMLYNSVLIKSS